MSGSVPPFFHMLFWHAYGQFYVYVMSLIPTNAEFMNEWNCTSIPPFALMAWTWTAIQLCYELR